MPMDNSEAENESVGRYNLVVLLSFFLEKQILQCMLLFCVITRCHASTIIIVLHVCLSKETLFFEVHCLGRGREK
jgi:hypothetical protein